MPVTSSTITTFKREVLDSSAPVVVKFFSLWDPNCRLVEDSYKALSDELRNVKFVESNVDSDPGSARSVGFTKLPTFAFFKGGKLVSKLSSVPSKRELREIITSALGA